MTMRLGLWEWLSAMLLSIWASIGLAVDLLVVLMAFDFLTGLACAMRKGTLSSHLSWIGLMRKAAVLIVVAVAHLIQQTIEMSQDVHFFVSLGQTVALAYCWNEIISILENCLCMGAPLPDLLKNLLASAPKMHAADEEERLS